jgi:hypothetical protein
MLVGEPDRDRIATGIWSAVTMLLAVRLGYEEFTRANQPAECFIK